MCRIRSTQPNTRRRGAVLAAALRLAAVSAAPAFAGPPFQTDDPEPIEYKHWENNLFTLETVTRGNAMGTGPGLDINYGLLPNVQLNPILPLEYQSGPGRPISFGNGNAEIGVKYRFYKPAEGDLSPQMAFYPFLEVPTGNKSLGFSTGHFQLLYCFGCSGSSARGPCMAAAIGSILVQKTETSGSRVLLRSATSLTG